MKNQFFNSVFPYVSPRAVSILRRYEQNRKKLLSALFCKYNKRKKSWENKNENKNAVKSLVMFMKGFLLGVSSSWVTARIWEWNITKFLNNEINRVANRQKTSLIDFEKLSGNYCVTLKAGGFLESSKYILLFSHVITLNMPFY